MTPKQVALVQDSFAKVAPTSEAAAMLFYDRLFDIAPQMKGMFPDDMTERRRVAVDAGEGPGGWLDAGSGGCVGHRLWRVVRLHDFRSIWSQSVAADDLLRLRKRPVGHRRLAVPERDTCSRGTTSGAADPYPSGITIIMKRIELLLRLVLQRSSAPIGIDNDA